MKKILSLVVGVIMSASAHAGYSKFIFDPQETPQSELSGYFIINDETRALAAYSLTAKSPTAPVISGVFRPQGGYSALIAASTYSMTGPTNFTAWSKYQDFFLQTLELDFLPPVNASQPSFDFTAVYKQQVLYTPVGYEHVKDGSYTFRGIVKKSVVDAETTAYLDSMGGYDTDVRQIIPDLISPPVDPEIPVEPSNPGEVPEPASAALMLAGLMGVTAMRRKKVRTTTP